MRQRILLAVLVLCLSVPLVVAAGAQRPKQKPQPSSPPPKEQTKTTPPGTAKPAPQTTKKAPVADTQWALLVGVSQYPGQIQSLTFPSDDARAVKDLLVSAAGFPEDHIRLLTDN